MRQKTFFAFVIAVSSVINLNAESIEMQSGRIKQFPGGPHSEAPEVDYDCELLVIKADTTYNSARIVVKNKFGQVLYDGILDIKNSRRSCMCLILTSGVLRFTAVRRYIGASSRKIDMRNF